MGDAGIHRRKPTRLRGYDYSHPGAYFVTVCTASRAFPFGNVIDGKMQLNNAGRVVLSAWTELPAHYAGLELDAFVVMPNHIHGIIVLHTAADKGAMVGAGSPRPLSVAESTVDEPGVVTAPLRVSFGRVVAYFKYESTKRINALHGTPGKRLWQRNYHEHVIRRGDSLDRIRRYIAGNPARWSFDRENPHAVHPEPADGWANA